jgi:small conductance mechanosensitive channel
MSIVLRQARGALLLACLLTIAAMPGHAEEASAAASTAPVAANTPGPGTTIPVNAPTDVVALRLLPMTVNELAGEADGWIREIQDRTARIVDLKIAMTDAAKDPTRTKALQSDLAALTESRRAVFKNFDQLLVSWESKGGNADAIAGHRKFVSALRADELKATDKGTLLTSANEWLVSKDGGIRVAWHAIGFVGALLLIWLLAKLVSRLVHQAVLRWDKFSTLLDRFLVRAAFWATMVVGTLTVLSWLGVRMTPILTLLGGLSFVAAFAMQSTLSNFAAGLMIMIYRPFDVGNVVTVGGVTGKVQAMNLVSTTLLTGDNQVIIVPNSNVWGSIITNANVRDTRRVDLAFDVRHEDDSAAVQRILEEVVAEHPLVMKEPAPAIHINEMTATAVKFICRVWARTEDHSAVFWDITEQVKRRFDSAGIPAAAPSASASAS